MTSPRFWLPLALVFLGALPSAAAPTAHLVKDINPVSSPASSSPNLYFSALGVTFFRATTPDLGSELWRTDGTLQGTYPLLDACPGACSGFLKWVGGTDRYILLFGTGGLWATDGTAANTFLVAQLSGFGGTFYGRSAVWIPRQGLVYFIGSDEYAAQLWRTDGTAAGTYRVTNFTGGDNSQLGELTDFNGRLFFRGTDEHGINLWTSDGTAKGTQLVYDFTPAPNDLDGPRLFRVAGRYLYFAAPTPRRGPQLWRSDGTQRGTLALTNFKAPQESLASVVAAAPLGQQLLFVGDSEDRGQELWISDGTLKGTQALTDYPKLLAFGQRRDPLSDFGYTFKGRLLYAVDDGAHGKEIWTSDGTRKGTRMMRDLCPGTCSGVLSADSLNPRGDQFYFRGSDGAHGFEPWISDGTAAGTHLLGDLCAGSCSSSPHFRQAKNQVYFWTWPDSDLPQLWTTDGTSAGTRKLTNFTGNVSQSLGFQGVAQGRELIFTGHSEAGRELWRSDGTVEGTRLVVDLDDSELGSANVRSFFEAQGAAYFLATDGTQNGIFKSDGTEAGTTLVTPLADSNFPYTVEKAFAVGDALIIWGNFGDGFNLWRLEPSGLVPFIPEGLQASSPVLAGNRLFFTAQDQEFRFSIWTSDGTSEGTRRGFDLEEAGIFNASKLTALGNQVYFRGYQVAEPFYICKLFRSDGTEAGTVPLAEFPRCENRDDPMIEQGGRLWFVNAYSTPQIRDLWMTDGIPGGTRAAALGVDFVETFFWAGSRLFFNGKNTEADYGLYVWDGASAPARRVSEYGFKTFFAPPILHSDGSVYYLANQRFPAALWRSDGTPEGTSEVFSELEAPLPSSPMHSLAGRLYYWNQSRIVEIDGATGQTRIILDGAGYLFQVGGRLFFPRYDRATGYELWALEDN